MSRRHGKARRRIFDCGHVGFGRFCHRCKQANALAMQAGDTRGGAKEIEGPRLLATASSRWGHGTHKPTPNWRAA